MGADLPSGAGAQPQFGASRTNHTSALKHQLYPSQEQHKTSHKQTRLADRFARNTTPYPHPLLQRPSVSHTGYVACAHSSRRAPQLPTASNTFTIGKMGSLATYFMDVVYSFTNCMVCFPSSPQLKINSRSFKILRLLGEVGTLLEARDAVD